MNARPILASRPVGLLATTALVATWLLFSVAHARAFSASGDWTYLLFVASETLVAALFMLRSEPAAVSHSPLDWLLAITSTGAPFFFAPSGEGLLPAARVLIVLGVLLQIGGLLSLNRSFGLVAAKRQIKTSGLYRWIRHPLYASYLLSYTGYVLSNTSTGNVATCLVASLLLLARLQREERFLSRDSEYALYMRRVKYRVLPMVF
ncbi:methyltransferase family protein [Pseudoduganella violaceinigra]|uniref:methyltransferase family protein n=1 Tax=Pseudoduganella violaceinigra TaxID=246602 RepID=UPI00040A44F5|nr:methyltransferase [Pseudoduganella violaceinigra]